MRLGIAVFLTAIVASLLTFWLTDPRTRATHTQEAIIADVVNEYCHSPKTDVHKYIGRTGAAATIAVNAGLGALAYAEVAKCMIKQ